MLIQSNLENSSKSVADRPYLKMNYSMKLTELKHYIEHKLS